MTDPKRIFISHATKDDALVDTIAEKLDVHVTTWIDHKENFGLSPSDPDWEYALRVAIQNCDAGVFIMTENSLNSKVCKSECLLIQNLGKPLYVIRAEAVAFKDIWLTISLIQYADYVKNADKAITDLIRAINGESGADIPTPAHKFTDAGQIHTNLPYLSNPLRGRESDMVWIREHLGKGVTQIIATGGMGKSRLCAEIALNYEYGAVWYRCEPYKTHADLQIALREHADLPEGTPFATTQATIIQRKPLLVVDNAETVPDNDRKNYVTILSALAGGGVPILLTSRRLWGELKPHIQHALGFLGRAQGEAITRDFANAENVSLTDAQISEFAQACRHYPRLIEFSLGQLSQGQKYDTIIRRLNKLSYDAHEDMQEALDEMITQTVAQMATEKYGADAERLLRRLTWLTATFPEAVIQALMPSDMDEDCLADALALLRRYQFVRYDADTDRYAIADLVREALGTDETTFDIYADFYIKRAEEIFDDTPIQHWADKEGGANVDDVMNIKALGSELMRQTQNGTTGDLARANAFAYATTRYVNYRLEERAWAWIEMGIAAVRQSLKDAPNDQSLKKRLSLFLHNMGSVYSALGEKQKALGYYEQALAIRREVGDRAGEAVALNNIGGVYHALGELQKALAYFEQALPIHRAVGNRGGEALTYFWMCYVYEALGDLDKAIEFVERAIQTTYSQDPNLKFFNDTLLSLKQKRGDAVPPEPSQPSEFDALIAKLADIYRQAGEDGLRQMLQQSNVPDAQIDEIITVVAQVANANNQPDNRIELDMNELVALYQQSEGALRQFLRQKG